MKLEYEYLLLGQIQEIKEIYYKSLRKRLSFRDAIKELTANGEQKYGVPDIPDFLSWNLQCYKELKRLICQIPVPVSNVLNLGYQNQDHVVYLSTAGRVQITMETCYKDEEYISIDYFSVVYVLKGCCILWVNHTTHKLQPGELCILPPKIPYAVFTEPEDLVINIISDKPHFEENFRMLLYHENIVSDFFRRALFQNVNEGIFFMLPPTKDIRSILRHLFAEFVKKDSYSDTLFNNYLQIFFTNMIRSTETTCQFYADKGNASIRMQMPAILEYIAANYQTITLELLAGHFHYDNAYLSKMIKLSTGKNYSTLITELKIKEATALLTASNMHIEEIAEAVGYNSADHFAYSFKKITGMTPRNYKKKWRNME